MALPAVVCFYAFRTGVRSKKLAVSMSASFLCGFGAVFLSSLMVALSLVFTGEAFFVVAKLLVIAHLPIMAVEGLITAFCVKFLKKVKPELLEVVYGQ
jgi:cobalt/nickel transport system permease protein